MTAGVAHKYADIDFNIERITPKIAERYLEFNTSNRRISPVTVRKLSQALRQGEWQLNGDTIRFDTDGKLLDGQHRLRAIVVSGIAADSCVIRGLPRPVFKTIDNGKLRTAGDCLHVLKYKNPNALAAAGRMLFAYEAPGWGGARVSAGKRVSNDQLLEVIARHPGLVSKGNDYMRKPLFTKLVPHSVGMLSYYMASRVSEDKANTFFTELGSGQFASTDSYLPQRQLHTTLHERSLEFIKPTTGEKLAWVITCWNAFRTGSGIKRLSRIVETIPRFDPEPF